MKVRTKGVTTCVYDKFHNLIEEFSTINNATKYAGLSTTTVSKYITKRPFETIAITLKLRKSN